MPALPCPASRICRPSTTPAGIDTRRVRGFDVTWPSGVISGVRRSSVRVLELDLDACDMVLASGCKATPGTTAAGGFETVCATERAARSEQLGKEVTEVRASAGTGRAAASFAAPGREFETLAPVGRRAEFLTLPPVGPELVVGRALFRVLEDFVRLLQLLEPLLGVLLLADVGMELARELAVGALDLILGRAPRHTHDCVVILESHGRRRLRRSWPR